MKIRISTQVCPGLGPSGVCVRAMVLSATHHCSQPDRTLLLENQYAEGGALLRFQLLKKQHKTKLKPYAGEAGGALAQFLEFSPA